MSIHATAIISPDAKLGENVSVGPYAVIEDGVTLGEGCELGAHAILHTGCELGKRVKVSPHAVLAGPPQDLSYAGSPSRVLIGDDSVIREYVTIHRSPSPDGLTRIGEQVYLMAMVHVGHDCHVHDGAVLTSYVGLSGHVEIGAKAVIGGHTAFHQFVRVGRLAMVSGTSRVVKDVPPFFIAEGNPCRMRGVNSVGLRRATTPSETRHQLKRAYRYLYQPGSSTTQAVAQIREELAPEPQLDELLAFIESSRRGITAGFERS